MHFSRMGAYDHHEIPIIVRGEGPYVYDEHGKRYLDGLSALFCVNSATAAPDIAQAGADQAKELGFFHQLVLRDPRAIELARPDRRPGSRRTSTGCSSRAAERGVETALTAVPPVPPSDGQPNKYKRSWPGTSLITAPAWAL